MPVKVVHVHALTGLQGRPRMSPAALSVVWDDVSNRKAIVGA